MSTLVPMGASQRQINKLIDPEMRELHTAADHLMQNLVGLSSKRDIKLDAFGYELDQASLQSRVFGLKTYEDSKYVAPHVMRELAAVRAIPRDDDGTLNGVPLTHDEARMAKLDMSNRQQVYTKLERLVNSGRWKRSNVGQRQKMAQKLIREVRKKSRERVLKTDVEARLRHRAVKLEQLTRMRSKAPASENASEVITAMRQTRAYKPKT